MGVLMELKCSLLWQMWLGYIYVQEQRACMLRGSSGVCVRAVIVPLRGFLWCVVGCPYVDGIVLPCRMPVYEIRVKREALSLSQQ